MLKEFVEFIAQQAVKAAGPQILKPESEPDHVYLLTRPDGTVERRDADPEPREHKAGDLEALTDWAKALPEPGKSVAWYHRSAVVLVADDRTRRDTVTLELTLSPQVLTLQQFESRAQAFKHADFMKLLRVTFADCLGRSGNLLEILKKVNFSAGKLAESSVGHAKASVGRTLESQVTGTAAIPERVELDVPVFVGALDNLRCVVRCALEPDGATETFSLIPLPGQLEAGIRTAEERIGVILHADLKGVAPVYYGRP